jgi:signal transduction histidine kinase/ligand-binding sensor domain-containing protein
MVQFVQRPVWAIFRTLYRWLLLLGMIVGSWPIHAERHPWTIDRYQHVSWTSNNGAPTGVTSLAQTSDGYLWIGSNSGLYRFDGVNFEHIESVGGKPLPMLGVFSLHASSDGGLWVGYEFGGISFIENGHLTQYGSKDGIPEKSIISGFTEDQNGVIWCTAVGVLYKHVGNHWEKIDSDEGVEGNEASFLRIASDGAFWVGTPTGLFYRAAGAKQFVPLDRKGFVLDIEQAPDGSMWVSYAQKLVEHWITTGSTPTLAPGALMSTSVGDIGFDHQGGLWVGGLGDGVHHIASEAINQHADLSTLNTSMESFGTTKGLSSDYVWPLLVDREGNVWVGTSAGVDRFSQSNFTPAPLPSGTHDFALVAGTNGAIWVGSSSKPVMELDGSRLRTFGIPPNSLAAYRDNDGEVYIGADSGIWKMSEAGGDHLTTLPKGREGKQQIDAFTKDRNGTWWVSISSGLPEVLGLYTWVNGQWGKVPVTGIAHALFTDPQGRVWAGYLHNRLVVFDGNQITTLGLAQGMTIGDTKAFLQNGRFLWIGGSNGLGYMDGWHWKMVALADGGALKNVTGIVSSENGDLWVHTLYGLYLLPINEVRQAETNPSYAMHYRKFDTMDGLPGAPALQYPLPSAVKGTDGRLWFATDNGVVWLDPAQLVSNTLPPSVVIDAIEADGKIYTPEAGLTLPALTKNLQITFSVLSLTKPERARAKIRVQGVDSNWRDIGAQREIGYSNLGPGHYEFDVMASNNDGVWNRIGAKIEFRIMPAFYQTHWFMVLCALIAAIAIWLAFALRVRQINRRLRVRLEARHAERERIARDLHDTLLQSFPALLLKIQNEVNDLSVNANDRRSLNQALDLARKVIAQGRDQVSQLRSEGCRNLAELLFDFAAEHTSRCWMPLSVSITGRKRSLKREIFEEVSFILQEAMLNAYKHSGGSLLIIRMSYRPEMLVLEVQDNGNGIDPAILAEGKTPGHWGLIGMRERARQMSAKFHIESYPGKGLLVTLCIPGRIAYASSPKVSRLFRSRLDEADA